LRAALDAGGTHAHCRGCKERINVSAPVAATGWHTVHACTPEHAIEVNVRSAGAEPWAWRYTADAIAASLLPPKGTARRRGATRD
jgi:hypothetical protein